jgi:hypothetical protein
MILVFKKGHKISEEQKRMMRKRMTGKKNPFYGKTHSEKTKKMLRERVYSEKTRKRISLAGMGRKHSEETKRKMTGRRHTEETKRKMSKSRKGKKTGRKLSEEHKKKLTFKGRKHTKKSKKKISSAGVGRVVTEETRKRISLTEKGKIISEETRMKLIRAFSTPEYRESLRARRARIKLPMKDTKPEKIVQAFCKSKKIKFQTSKWFDLGFQRAEVDLFIEPNICILVDGDWVHANPNLIKPDGTMRYPPDRVLHKAYKNRPEKTVLDKWVNDDMITKGLKKQYHLKVLRFWEHDILNNPDVFRQKILKATK